MVAIKPQIADRFLAAPDAGIDAILLFGTDAGLVTERAQRLVRLLAGRENPPGEVVRLDELDLENDPDRLAVELQTLPMFGGRKIVRVAVGRRINAAALKPLLQGAPIEGRLIVEAGSLRPNDTLRGLFEKSPRGAAVPCYQDAARDLTAMIAETLQAAALTISPEAHEQLVARLGADRAMSRGEIEKLVLYVAGRGTVEVDDVDAIVGDAAEQALDRLANAAGLGRRAQALQECERAVAAGESPQTIILATQRHFVRLHRVRSAVDAGRGLQDVIRQLRPEVHFKQRDAFEAQCRNWDRPRLQSALAAIATAARSARLNPSVETALAERLVLALAVFAGPGGRKSQA